MAAVGTQPKSETKENLKLEITRVIKASREQVFNAWMRPETIRQWFRPTTMTMEEVSVDAHVGGEYRFAMRGSCEGETESKDAVVTGRYVRVDPFDALAFTWKNYRYPGEESLVTIELRDVEGGTEMKLTHEGFLTTESRDRHLSGWSSVVPNLSELLEKN